MGETRPLLDRGVARLHYSDGYDLNAQTHRQKKKDTYLTVMTQHTFSRSPPTLKVKTGQFSYKVSKRTKLLTLTVVVMI